MNVAEREPNERSDGQPMVCASTQTDKLSAAFGHRHEARAHPDPRSRVPSTRTRQPIAEPTRERPRRALAGGIDERLRLARDLHDGVQAELVSLLIRLKRAEEDHATPPALARTLAALGDHAAAALASVHEIALGIYPPALARFGVVEALRALATRASTPVTISGTAPRSSDDAEAAVYFSCSEAIQNVAKHAGRSARVTLTLHRAHGTLAVRVEDDGRGFDPLHAHEGAGLGNIRDRINALGGRVQLDSHPGLGTVLTLSLPRPRPQLRGRPGLDTARDPPEPRTDESARSYLRAARGFAAVGTLLRHHRRRRADQLMTLTNSNP